MYVCTYILRIHAISILVRDNDKLGMQPEQNCVGNKPTMRVNKIRYLRFVIVLLRRNEMRFDNYRT